MRRNLIAGTAALAMVGAGVGAATVIGSDSSVTAPGVQQVRVELSERSAGSRALAGKAGKPKIIYLRGSNTIDPAIGAYVDVTLSSPACKGKGRLLDGGVAAADTNVFQQGTYIVPGKGEYHVLLGFDDAASEAPVAYEIATHLICAKGVR